MRDEEDHPLLAPLGEIAEQLALGDRIEGSGRFVEDEDGRVANDGASDGQALALARGELAAALAKFGLVALLHLADELVRARDLRRRFHVRHRLAFGGVADVVGDGAGEQHVLLQGDGGGGADVVHAQVADVGVVEDNGALLRIVEPQDHRHEGGLARSGGADDGRDGAGVCHEVNAAKHRQPLGGLRKGRACPVLCRVRRKHRHLVGEMQIAAGNAAERSREGSRIVAVNDVRLKVEQEEGAL